MLPVSVQTSIFKMAAGVAPSVFPPVRVDLQAEKKVQINIGELQ